MEDSPRGTVLGASAANSGSGGKRLLLVAAGVTLVATVAAGAYFWFSDSGTMARAEATVLGGPHAPNPSSGTALESILSPASANSIVSGAASPATKPTPVVSMAETRQEARRYARAGEDHSRRKEWAAAAVALQKAYQLDPLLNVEDALAKAITHLEEAAKLEKEMAEATQLFEEGDYASSLHKLYRLQQEFKGERPFEIYIKNAWFDWGVVLMNSGAIDEAAEKFEEVLEIDSKDQDASRARAVALKYLRRPRDRSFDRFASALPTRTMNGR